MKLLDLELLDVEVDNATEFEELFHFLDFSISRWNIGSSKQAAFTLAKIKKGGLILVPLKFSLSNTC